MDHRGINQAWVEKKQCCHGLSLLLLPASASQQVLVDGVSAAGGAARQPGPSSSAACPLTARDKWHTRIICSFLRSCMIVVRVETANVVLNELVRSFVAGWSSATGGTKYLGVKYLGD